MPSDMSHERYRWQRMTQRQLVTRLNRITVRQKLENYLLMCSEQGEEVLWDLAITRAVSLGYFDIADHWRSRLHSRHFTHEYTHTDSNYVSEAASVCNLALHEEQRPQVRLIRIRRQA